jgi:hypothetical protein
MDMVGHQNPGPASNSCRFQAISEKIAVQGKVSIVKESALAAITALSDVMRQTGNDKTRGFGDSAFNRMS